MDKKDFRYGSKNRRYLSKSKKSKKLKLNNLLKKKNTIIYNDQDSDLSAPNAVFDEFICSSYSQDKDDDQTRIVAEKEIKNSCAGEISTNTSTIPVEAKCSGRRLVDIMFLFDSIKNIDHHPFDCTFKNLIFIKEIRNGFFSEFIFKCNLCNKQEVITNEDPDNMTLNSAIVAGIVNTGQGYTQLDTFSAFLNMHNMSNKLYQKIHNDLNKYTEDASLEAMEMAGKEEARLAIEENNVNEDGIPLVTVVADGTWSKRSYKSNYNALSGAATIIGYRTKKILFMGIRNKFCAVCQKSESTKQEVSVHKCFKNWDGTSTSMEADIIVEGFRQSMSMHNVIFNKLIGDGDSSVMKKLSLVKPYGPDMFIKKIECVNHILRNYCNRIVDMFTRRKSTSGMVVPGVLRKILKDRRLKLRCAVTKAIAFRKELNLSHNEKVALLKQDILNSPYHVFGSHNDCASYFCKGSKENEVNLVPQMETSGLWVDILGARNIVAHHASSLIYNVNNNVVEGFNNVIAKYIGGKRINFSFRGSYGARCHTAVTSFNLGSNYISHLHKKITSLSPGIITKKYIKKVEKISELSRKRRLNFKKPTFTMNKRKLFCGPDNDYGAVEMGCEIIDMPLDEYQIKKEIFLKKLMLTNEDIVSIERKTVGQQDNDMWQKLRKSRLTASNFGKVCKLRPTTSRANTVKYILYDIFQGSSATRNGIENESIARNAVQENLGITIKSAGLFIHKTLHYLAASPDGLINEDSILEIKCPSSIKEYTPQEAVALKKLKYMTDYEGKIVLKKSDNYYFQVQGQLNITEKKYCYFVVWTPKGFVIDKVPRDESFWKTKIEPFVTRFYMESLLPEMIDSRFDRGLPIRPGISDKPDNC